jgi:hypothetical protein
MLLNNLPKLSSTEASPRGINSGRIGTEYNSPRIGLNPEDGANVSPRQAVLVKTRNNSLSVRTEARSIANSMALPKGSWKVSVADMVKSSKRNNDEYGIGGYSFISYNPHIDKPSVFSIVKEVPGKTPRDHISML